MDNDTKVTIIAIACITIITIASVTAVFLTSGITCS